MWDKYTTTTNKICVKDRYKFESIVRRQKCRQRSDQTRARDNKKGWMSAASVIDVLKCKYLFDKKHSRQSEHAFCLQLGDKI
jgi:hypothetical protein